MTPLEKAIFDVHRFAQGAPIKIGVLEGFNETCLEFKTKGGASLISDKDYNILLELKEKAIVGVKYLVNYTYNSKQLNALEAWLMYEYNKAGVNIEEITIRNPIKIWMGKMLDLINGELRVVSTHPITHAEVLGELKELNDTITHFHQVLFGVLVKAA